MEQKEESANDWLNMASKQGEIRGERIFKTMGGIPLASGVKEEGSWSIIFIIISWVGGENEKLTLFAVLHVVRLAEEEVVLTMDNVSVWWFWLRTVGLLKKVLLRWLAKVYGSDIISPLINREGISLDFDLGTKSLRIEKEFLWEPEEKNFLL